MLENSIEYSSDYAAMKTNKMANLLQNKELTTHAPTG